MTCIVAFTPDDHSIYMVADKRTSCGSSYTDGTEKLVAHQHMLMAASGDRRLANLLQTINVLDFDVPKTIDSYDAFMSKLLQRIVDQIDLHKYAVIRDAARTMPDSEIVVGLPGCIYTISWDLAVTEIGWKYWTTGSGGRIALGWLHGWYGRVRQLTPDKIENALRDSVKVAAQFDSGVSSTASFAARQMPL